MSPSDQKLAPDFGVRTTTQRSSGTGLSLPADRATTCRIAGRSPRHRSHGSTMRRSTTPPSFHAVPPTFTGAKRYGIAQDAATAAGRSPSVRSVAAPSGPVTPTASGRGSSAKVAGRRSRSQAMSGAREKAPRQGAR